MPLRTNFGKASGRRLAGLVLLSAGMAALAQAPARPSPPRRKPYGNPHAVQHAPRRRYHVLNYRIRLRLDEPQRSIAGAVTITLRPLAAGLRQLALDSSGLAITSVRLLAPGTPQALRFQRRDPRLTIELPRAYAPSETLRLRIAYHGAPKRGLTFLAPGARSPNRPAEVWSYGWPTNNHYWFPCWDYPNDKAASETIISVPAGQAVVSNGALVRVERAAGWATYDWREPAPHSAYLVSIAAGRWTELRQRLGKLPVNAYVPPGVSLARARRSFALTPDMIGFYGRTFGMPYPYAKYAQVAAHDFSGGLENISATTLTDLTLHAAAGEPDYSSLGLVSHELAHQWFGDLVTERSWANAWLSEGFATFGAALYAGHHAGPHAYRYQIWLDQNAAREEDLTRYRRPIVDRHYTHPWGILDRTTYEKGAAVLDMLRMTLDHGREPAAASPREPLFRALSAYLHRYRARNVDTRELMASLRSATGWNPRRFFRQWVYGAGFPEYRVAAGYDAGRKAERVSIAQTQSSAWQTARVFAMPIELAFYGAGGARKRVMVEDRRRRQSFTVPLGFRPQWVDFDPHDYIFKTADFPRPAQALLAAARRDRAAMARLEAVQQLGALPRCGCGVIAGLRRSLGQDAFYGVRIEAARALGGLQRPRAMQALLNHLYRNSDSRVRAAIVAALGRYSRNPAAFKQLERRLTTDASPAVEAAAARALGRPGQPQAYRLLAARLAQPQAWQVEYALIAALAATRDRRAAGRLQQLARQAPRRMERRLAARLAKRRQKPK